ncbi:aconitase family protein, partial [Bordetella bronchiseptica]
MLSRMTNRGYMNASFLHLGTPIHYADVAAAAARSGVELASLPYVIRILLENLLRHRGRGRPVQEAEIEAVAHWQAHISEQISLHVERVILPDSSGLPVLQDLAALRDAVQAGGGDPARVDTRVPVDLIVDHSLQVDAWSTADAVRRNLDAEFARNEERYRFLKWAQQAFDGLRVFAPGTGIIHQVNLEKLATVVSTSEHGGQQWACPDFVIGGDSHTPMVNGLGVLGWGVGGIDAESALLGRAYTFPIPEVVGVELKGAFRSPVTTTDAALLVTQRLRAEGVTGCMVEFFGEALPGLSVADRATIANMAPEYGATCGFFPVDAQTLDYLRLTGRTAEHIELVRAYCQANGLWRADPAASAVRYARVVRIDLAQAEPCMSGPRRPQDRLPIGQLAEDFRQRLPRPAAEGGFGLD